jgi:ADP-ribosylglycohydrolase
MHAIALLDQADTELERRVLLSLMAFAAGDAFGVTYEYTSEPLPVDIGSMGTRADWPFGGVSDDTLLSLLTIFSVTRDQPRASASAFLERLRREAPELRGLGPTTRAALGMEVAEEHRSLVGNTNGGMMRTALLGLGFGPRRATERRQMVAELTRATHTEPAAVACAVLCSALYSDAAETGTSREPITVLRDEAASLDDVPLTLTDQLSRFEDWAPPTAGVPLEPGETLLAVTWVISNTTGLADAYRLACELGGDTDTVAALAGGVVAARNAQRAGLLGIPWVDDVLWSEVPELVTAASVLSELRIEQ